MALAMATAGPDGQMLERYEYAEIRYGPRLAANNEPAADHAARSRACRGAGVLFDSGGARRWCLRSQ